MNEQQIGLLVIQLAGMLSVLGCIGFMLIKSSEEQERFKLYKIRDQLVYLAATGELPQASLVFRVFYRAVNASISEAQNLTFASLVRASMMAKTVLEQEKRERLVESVHRTSPEAQRVIAEFLGTMMTIAYENSLGLRIFVACKGMVKSTLSVFLKAAKAVNPPKPYAYETYEYWREMQRICHA
ncbi:MAG: hypothetical protein WD733_18655 [Bryobacterales bacterium]